MTFQGGGRVTPCALGYRKQPPARTACPLAILGGHPLHLAVAASGVHVCVPSHVRPAAVPAGWPAERRPGPQGPDTYLPAG